MQNNGLDPLLMYHRTEAARIYRRQKQANLEATLTNRIESPVEGENIAGDRTASATHRSESELSSPDHSVHIVE